MVDDLLNNLELYYPWIREKITDYEYDGKFKVTAVLNDGKNIEYNDISHSMRYLPTDKHNMTEEEYRSEFAHRLRYIMIIKGVSQIELAEMTNIPQSAISGYMSGNIGTPYARAAIIARALGCSLDDLQYT